MNAMEKTTAPAVPHAVMANAIRFLAMDAVERAKSGHPGLPMGMADVALAVEAAAALLKMGKRAAVVSMPCWDLSEAQPESYRRQVLGTAPRTAIEALCRLGWDRWIGERGAFIGMSGFGASAPAGDLYKHFGVTVDAIVATAATLTP